MPTIENGTAIAGAAHRVHAHPWNAAMSTKPLRLILLALLAAGYAIRRRKRRAAVSERSAARPAAIDRWEGEGGGVPVSRQRTAAQVPVELREVH